MKSIYVQLVLGVIASLVAAVLWPLIWPLIKPPPKPDVVAELLHRSGVPLEALLVHQQGQPTRVSNAEGLVKVAPGELQISDSNGEDFVVMNSLPGHVTRKAAVPEGVKRITIFLSRFSEVARPIPALTPANHPPTRSRAASGRKASPSRRSRPGHGGR